MGRDRKVCWNSVTTVDGATRRATGSQRIRDTACGGDDQKKPYNYLVGMVYDDPEKMAGHHADWTLFIGDESSGLDDKSYEMAQGWAKHMLLIGNCNPCANFFKRGIQAGDLEAKS